MDSKLIIISIAFGVSCLLLFIRLLSNFSGRKLEKYILENFDKDEIIGSTTRANFIGRKSDGLKQIRGNGALVLTKNMLIFIRIMPFKEYKIQTNDIKSITLPRSFLGKSVLAKLLCVNYASKENQDAIAFAVRKPAKWKDAILSLTQKT